MKNLILFLALCLIPLVSLNAQPNIVVKKRPFSRIIIVNGIRIKITRPLFRKRYRKPLSPEIIRLLPPEVMPYLYKRSHEGFHKEIKPLYYDSIDSDRLRNLA